MTETVVLKVAAPTAVEVAFNKAAQKDETPLTTLTVARIKDCKPIPKETLEDGRQLAITEATVQAATWASGTSATPEEAKQLHELESRMRSLYVQAAEFNPAKVIAHINRQRDELHTAVASGASVDSVSLASRDEVELNFRSRHAALIAALKTICHAQVVPVCASILKRFEDGLEAEMRHIEEADRSACIGWGLDYRPSLVWRALATVRQRYDSKNHLPASHTWGFPSQILKGVVDL